MRGALEKMPAGAIVVLHACCHNPTGVDPTPEQWGAVLDIVRRRGLVPFLDIAYQGFADGIDEDGAVVRRFAATPGPLFVSSSFSKSFSLYGERVGALSVATADREEAARVLSQLKRVVRANYSNPPTHGGQIVASVLSDPKRRAVWEGELAGMRMRIRRMREALRARARGPRPGRRFLVRDPPARDVLVHRPQQGAGDTPARGILDLRGRYGAHLRRRPQRQQRRRGRRRDRRGEPLTAAPLTDRGFAI